MNHAPVREAVLSAAYRVLCGLLITVVIGCAPTRQYEAVFPEDSRVASVRVKEKAEEESFVRPYTLTIRRDKDEAIVIHVPETDKPPSEWRAEVVRAGTRKPIDLRKVAERVKPGTHRARELEWLREEYPALRKKAGPVPEGVRYETTVPE